MLSGGVLSLIMAQWIAGGETIFPLEGPDGMKVLQYIDYRSCKDGYMVLPSGHVTVAFCMLVWRLNHLRQYELQAVIAHHDFLVSAAFLNLSQHCSPDDLGCVHCSTGLEKETLSCS
jgi:hypothetical protein